MSTTEQRVSERRAILIDSLAKRGMRSRGVTPPRTVPTVDPPPADLVDRIATAIAAEQEPCSNHACRTTDHDGLDPWGLCGPCVEDALARAEEDR